MSRSTRKPYHYWCGASVKSDRQMAARRYRALENQRIREMLRNESFEEYMHPVQYEASFNDRWSWSCDGSAVLYDRPHNHALTYAGLGDISWVEDALGYIARIQRK